MLRKFLDYQLDLTAEGKPLSKLRPAVDMIDTICYEPSLTTKVGPHIRDALDLKRWMILVVVALLPCTLMAIWNTGLQAFVYGSFDFQLMDEYLLANQSMRDYFAFAGKHWWSFLKLGLGAFLPVVIVSYVVGGIWEVLFACVRGHEVSEGFLVTGILFALILPSTLPLWMVAVGVSVGVVLAKELFGGSGMNIFNPALACRAFLFFAFPGRMSGSVWAGTNPHTIRESLIKMNQDAGRGALDGYTQASMLAKFNVSPDIKKVHIDAIATNNIGMDVPTHALIERQHGLWSQGANTLGDLTQEQMYSFVTSPLAGGGLGLPPGSYEDAYHLSSLSYGIGPHNDWNLFLGDRLGSMGETSVLACLLGALFLIWTGVGSWRTMVAMALGAYFTAVVFQLSAMFIGPDVGAWNSALFAFPAYKHLLLGGLPFGLVFMATDPVTHPSNNGAKWVFGLFCGFVTILIRLINPAYPEGVMLAILLGNGFAPLFDYYGAIWNRQRRVRRELA